MQLIYLSRDINTNEITNITKVNIDKTQEEIDVLIKEYNEKATHYINEQIKDKRMLELAKFSIKWKGQKTLEDISSDLDDIYRLVDDAKDSIDDFIYWEKKNAPTERENK